MTVSELRKALKCCSAEAIVEVEGYDVGAEVTGLEETFYNSPSNKCVVLTSALSFESNEAIANKVELESLRFRLAKIRAVINSD